jgi:hypothetical protein
MANPILMLLSNNSRISFLYTITLSSWLILIGMFVFSKSFSYDNSIICFFQCQKKKFVNLINKHFSILVQKFSIFCCKIESFNCSSILLYCNSCFKTFVYFSLLFILSLLLFFLSLMPFVIEYSLNSLTSLSCDYVSPLKI